MELDHWQREFENEVNGQRSGIVGLGPRARSIQTDQLAWRRDEATRIGEMLKYLTEQCNELSGQVKAAEDTIKEEFVGIAAAKAERLKDERERVAKLKRQVQQSQADQFVVQQNSIRDTIAAQIDTCLEKLTRLQGELVSIDTKEQERIETEKARFCRGEG